MRVIDAGVATTDSVSFGRIGDLKIQVHRDGGKELADHRRFTLVGDQHRSLLLRPAKPVAARVEGYL
jgi:hypothetical protein